MKIIYRQIDEYIPVDTEKLRPKGSYNNLISKRTHNLDELIDKYGKIPEDLLMKRNCPGCESKNSKNIIKKDHLNIVKCLDCETVFVNPIFNEDYYRKTYQSKEYQEIVKELGEDSHNYRKERFGQERVGIMKKFLKNKSNIKYLDIGSSTGFVVEAAQEVGWDAMGIELNPSAVQFGKKRGLKIIKGDLLDCNLNNKKFDVISLFDVLEHLPSPRATINEVIKKLKPEGIIFLYVPNFDSASRILMGDQAHFIWPSHHLNYYNPKTIKNFLDSFPLRVEYIATEGLDIEDYIWYKEEVVKEDMQSVIKIKSQLQFFINAGGYGKNLRIIARKK